MQLDLVHKLATEDKIAFKRHTLIRMFQREVGTDEIKEALAHCEIIESYPADKPLPSALVLGYTSKKRPLHLVIAVDAQEQMVWVITVYEPSAREWNKGFKERKNG